MLIYLVLGMFLDPIGIMVLTLPFMIPLVEGYGMDLIWFGVIVVKLLEIGLITPPVGLNVFVVSNVTKSVGIDKIFAGVTRFLAVDMLVLLLLILFPGPSRCCILGSMWMTRRATPIARTTATLPPRWRAGCRCCGRSGPMTTG